MNNTSIEDLFTAVIEGNFKPTFENYHRIKKAGFRLTLQQMKQGFKLLEMYSQQQKKRTLGKTEYNARVFDKTWKTDGHTEIFGDSVPFDYEQSELEEIGNYESEVDCDTDDEQEYGDFSDSEADYGYDTS